MILLCRGFDWQGDGSGRDRLDIVADEQVLSRDYCRNPPEGEMLKLLPNIQH